MQAIVSILDEAHCAKVEALWDELEREFGLKQACVAYPHFTYQVVDAYEVPAITPIVRRCAQSVRPFDVVSTGLGIFTGPNPVLYIRVVRDGELTRFHDLLWSLIGPYTTNMHHHHYGHLHWIPHVTLAAGDLTHDILPEAIRLFSRREFNWEIRVDNVALVTDVRGGRDEWIRFPLLSAGNADAEAARA